MTLNRVYKSLLPQYMERSETFTATEGQTVFTLTSGVFEPGKRQVEVYITGVRQTPLNYTETDQRTITLGGPMAEGELIEIVWKELRMPNVNHANTHKAGGVDEISITELAGYQTQVADKIGIVQKKTGWIDVSEYGATGNGTTDDTTAIQNAANAATAAGKVLRFPAGTFKYSSQLTFDSISVIGDATGTTLKPTAIGAGVASIVISQTIASRLSPVIEKLNLLGPGTYSLGTKTANVNGIKVIGSAKPYFRDVKMLGFDYGLIWANDVGHIYHQNVEIANCYYGIYCEKNTFDYYMKDCKINGNTFANVACGDGGLNAIYWDSCHMGFAPFSIYQEPRVGTGEKTFIVNMYLNQVRFEAIGNAAIYSEHDGVSPNYTWCGTWTIKDPGFSWYSVDSRYTIATKPKDFSVVIPNLQHKITIDANEYAFDYGLVNRIQIKQGVYGPTDDISVNLVGRQFLETDVTVTAGTKPLISAGARYLVASTSQKSIVNMMSGLDETVGVASQGNFIGWVFNVDRPTKFDSLFVDVKTATNVINASLWDARTSLSNMPLIKRTGGYSLSATGLLNMNMGGQLLQAGRYVVGICVYSTASKFGGSLNSNLAALRDAVVNTTDVFSAAPTTLTVTENSTLSVNMSLR